MTAHGEQLGDAPWACRAMLTGGFGFMWSVLLCASLLILPLSLTSPGKAGSRNPPPPFSPILGGDVVSMQGR